MSEHECKQDTIWHMDEHRFSTGCWECVYGQSVWPAWAHNIIVSPAKRMLMESVMARGIVVDTDGSDTLALIDGRAIPIWFAATAEELAAYDTVVRP